ncbi:MAG TPA: ATPase, T2SS/T4P/T4SS family [Actinomycetes bacterium]
MAAAVSAARRGRHLMVVDLPRRPDPAAEVALATARTTYLLVPAEARWPGCPASCSTTWGCSVGVVGAALPDRSAPAAVPPELVDRVRSRLAAAVAAGAAPAGPPSAAAVAVALRAEGRVLGDAELLAVVDRLQNEIVGLGSLAPLVADPAVTDVLVNAADEVWVDRGRGLKRVRVRFPDEAAARRFAQRLAAAGGRRLDDAAPYADVRLQAVRSPVAPQGTCVSSRVPRRSAFTLDELVAAGSLSADSARLLDALMTSKAAFLGPRWPGWPNRWPPPGPR